MIIQDLQKGDEGENLVKSQLEKLGYICEFNTTKDKSAFDLIINNKIKIEVKNDLWAKKSGNIAIEYNNCRSNKPSGLSVTKAKLWCHIVDGAPLVVKVTALKKFVKNTKPKRTVNKAGDGNADIYLYAIKDIEHIFIPLDRIGELL